jgi:curved DNA-binding protein CbpA
MQVVSRMVVVVQMNESDIRRVLCEILGVDVQASAEEIKKAYTSEAKKWHPDRVQHNPELAAMAEKKLKDINQAYECLTDKNQFDKHGAKLAARYVDGNAASANSTKSANGTNSAKSANSTNSTKSATSGNSANSANSTNATNSTNSANSSHATSSTASTNRSNSAPSPDRSGIVKIFIATGIFVIIVVLVANLTAPRSETVATPGVTLSPSDSPGAPFSGSRSFAPQSTSLPPDSSVAAPPGSN